MRVIVDRERCIASGQCVLAAGAVFDQDDDGFVLLLDADPPPELLEDVRRAASLCPSGAIRVVE
jgi:ferredoxin